ncbi:MAG: glycosyltransferase family 2 protein [Bacteroidota bacterium]
MAALASATRTARTTVVLVNYNGDADTRRCLASLAAAGAPPVVIVDNASEQIGFEDVLAGYPGASALLRMRENVGFGRANNVGIAHALRGGASFVFVLNNDTVVEADTLARLEAALDAEPTRGLATPRTVYLEAPDVLWYGGGEVSWLRGSAVAPGYGGAAEAPLAMTPRPVGFASGCAMLLRAEALRDAGGFDPRYFMYEEDVELSLRLQRAGWSLWYEPTSFLYHRVGGSSTASEASTSQRGRRAGNPRLAFYLHHQTRNRILTALRHARGLDALRFWLGFPVYWTALLVRYASQGRLDAAAAAARGAVSALKAARGATDPPPQFDGCALADERVVRQEEHRSVTSNTP